MVSSTVTKSLENLVKMLPIKWESKKRMVLFSTFRTMALCMLMEASRAKAKNANNLIKDNTIEVMATMT
jgi:hypothetical protein